jgi:hypothetical protein
MRTKGFSGTPARRDRCEQSVLPGMMPGCSTPTSSLSTPFAPLEVDRYPDQKDHEQQMLHVLSVAAFRVSATSFSCDTPA